jgi:hypothetical protein
MFKLVHSHKYAKHLTFADTTFKRLLAQGEIRYPENWKTVLVIFNIIKINL